LCWNLTDRSRRKIEIPFDCTLKAALGWQTPGFKKLFASFSRSFRAVMVCDGFIDEEAAGAFDSLQGTRCSASTALASGYLRRSAA